MSKKIELLPIKISTITFIGSLYNNDIAGKTNLGLLDKLLQKHIGKEIKNFKYFPTTNNRNDKKDFSHTGTISLENLDKTHVIRIKICKNGVLHATGVRSLEERDYIVSSLYNILKPYKDTPGLFLYPLVISLYKSPMVIANTCIKDPTIKIDNIKLLGLNGIDNSIYIIYRKKGAGAELRTNNATYTIFSSGKINISFSNIDKYDEKIFHFINNFLNDNINKLIMTDKIIENIENIKNTKNKKQGSQEWLDERKAKITATRLGLCLGYKSFGKTREDLIRIMINELHGIPEPYFKNPFCEKGTKYEPIARKVYLFHKSTQMPQYKYVVFESGMITHKKYNFIGASPDGLVFVLNSQILSLPKDLDELLECYKSKNIIDVYLIEIKCPWNYKGPYKSSKENKECVNGYVPLNYWAQMQQQMAVTGIKYVTFINNNIREYNNEESYINAFNTPNYKGIIIVYQKSKENSDLNEPADDGKEYVIYPGDIESPWDVTNVLCNNAERMKIVKQDLDNKLKKIIGTVYHFKYVYWYMETLPEITLVNFDEKWYENIALPAMKSVIDVVMKV